jgi:thiol-disulfide isomerase/thioredoxin
MRPARPRAAAAIAGIALAAFDGGCDSRHAAGGRAPDSGSARHVEVVDLDALARRIAATGARITVVNFWATWCAPCVAELPDLVAAVKARGDRSVALLLVSYDLNTPGSGLTRETVVPLVREFVEKRGLDGDVAIYDGETTRLDERFDLPGPIPATIVVDASGKVVARHAGAATRAQFDALLEGALAK